MKNTTKVLESMAGLVSLLRATMPEGAASLASEVGVSATTVDRWASGLSYPRPSAESKIRGVAERVLASAYTTQTALFEWPDVSPDQRIRAGLTATCRQLREVLHRRARFGTRQEALDELAKLLYTHVSDVAHGGEGLSLVKFSGSGAAKRLREFVGRMNRSHLPKALLRELEGHEIDLRIGSDDDELATEVVDCFSFIATPDLLGTLRGENSVDVLHDVFGQFIADSFSHEKEMGQYLTPPEVVQFMVRLGLRSLDETRRAALIDSKKNRAALVLDPSCGVASFLMEALRVLAKDARNKFGAKRAREVVSRLVSERLFGLDKSERMVRLALLNLGLFGAEAENIHLANALSRSGPDGSLTSSLEGRASLILTNPPFGASFEGESLGKYGFWIKNAKRAPASIDSELLFLERYADWLAPGGQLLAIVPDSVLSNRGIFEDIRQYLINRLRIRSVVSLPVVTFGLAGTQTKTSILHAEKPLTARRSSRVYFAVCKSVGFDVQTRNAMRVRVDRGQNDLPAIFDALTWTGKPKIGVLADLDSSAPRWDAGVFIHQVGGATAPGGGADTGALTPLSDLAELVDTRTNPLRRGSAESFLYIEISNVEGTDMTVTAKLVPCAEAPSRARKLVREGDILVSTVRPDRRTVGVVPASLDGAVCSTGFAVLRPKGIHPLALAWLLRSEFATEQLVAQVSGIAYPVVSEDVLMKVLLPIGKAVVGRVKKAASDLEEARQRYELQKSVFAEAMVKVERREA